MEKNPCTHATVPKHKSQKRDIWTADTLMYALSVCEDERLKLAINLSFSCSLRLGELLGLTWDCVDISHEAIEENRAYVFINKESQRIRKESLNALDGKDVLLVFPTNHKKNSTVRILKTPKTESSVRKIFLPKSVANMLVDWKAEQDEMKEILGDEYMDYNLVMASTFGLPLGDGAIRGPLTVKQNFEENSNEKGIDLTGTYEFRALDIGIPMPGDSDNDRHVFVLDGNNAEKMISLQFQHGGVYRYHLVQTSKDKENYTYDRSSYIIAVYIKNGENGKLVPQVIAEKNDGKKYGELMFYNSYNKRNI